MSKKLIIIIQDNNLRKKIKDKISFLDYEIYYFDEIKQFVDILYEEIPDLIIVDSLSNPYMENSFINQIKNDPLFVSMVVISIVPDDFKYDYWDKLLIDDYIRLGNLDKDLKMRIEISLKRVERIIATNPLTKLPGNLVIQREIQKRLDRGEIFALAYADLDNFKPFNDKYGFSRGDDVIKILGRIIMNIIKSEQPTGSFIGHIGGDDFVYIMSPELIENATIKIIDIFENLIRNFYDVEDLRKGFIESTNRKGEKQFFPIMSVSVGITSNKFRRFKHFSEMAEVASEMKAIAKKQENKRYAIDRRKDIDLIKQIH